MNQSNQSHVDINELNKVIQNSFIHYQPDRVDYTIDESELKELSNIGASTSKDISFGTLGVAIPTIVNGLVTYSKENGTISLEVLVNFIVGSATLALGVYTYYKWRKELTDMKDIISKIKSKPQFRLPGPKA